ncbi:MAG: T9SS type A sorting domain-containing protein [Saprospiraceae bacterium]|nr:T9SS type A sorting domain-containing protein [Candidatus Opimibacter skivensis]
MKTTHYPTGARLLVVALTLWLIGLPSGAFSQAPLITTRLANPVYDCISDQYCLDVEFQSNTENVQVFGMNVRFFYDDTFMELIGFSDFQPGYGPVMPDPPMIMTTLPPSATTNFGFPLPGIADFVNGAIQLVDESQPPIFIDLVGWTKLFQVCFTVEGTLPDSANFCPPVVLDLEANPANGGYLPGDDGVVITIVDVPPAMSGPSTENVEQFNWAYSGPGTAPFGAPEPTQCVSLLCLADFALLKTLNAGQDNLNPGDNVTFTIDVTNEGDITADELHLVDYIPVGFSLNDADWTAGILGSTGQSASIILSTTNGGLPPGGLLSGGNVTVEITLQISPDIPSGVYENFAEITAVFDPGGDDISNDDVDSTPDEDDTNDLDPEDDHDGELICLLLPPPITGDLFVCEGDTVEYFAGLYNPDFTYVFALPIGGGTIISTTDSSATVEWTGDPGTIYEVTLTETAYDGCDATSTIFVTIEEAGAIACYDHLNVSIDNACGTVILSGTILTGEMEGNNTYEVFIIDIHGDTVPNATLTYEHVGQTFKVSVVSQCTGQSCWGYVTVEDKLGPIINCICAPDETSLRCTITCFEIEEILAGNIPERLRPTVFDNCGSPTLEVTNVDLHYETCEGGYVEVTWLATDASGNTSTCTQLFTIVPLNLESLLFPPDYLGECGDSSDPSNTGWPQVYGDDITNVPGHCNIISSYIDKPIQLCGGGIKIMRTWTVFDWCVPTRIDHVQFIDLGDHVGPVLTCAADRLVSTDVWSCYATVNIPKPQAVDICSNITSYKLTSSAGVVVQVGNNYSIKELPIGTHTVTWTVTDECYNSSTCSSLIRVADSVPPVVSCHQHTIVGLTSDRVNGLTIVPADVFDDGSFDNCGPVTFRARRMTSCLEFDWTTEGACMDEIPGGAPPINSRDHGTVLRSCVPFACCDVGQLVMIELEVTDEAGNINYCMVEVEVQDKLAPVLTCPEEILVSCEYLFDIEEGIFSDSDGNRDGSLDEDPLSEIFGNMYDAARYTQADRKHIVINDPDNPQVTHPFDWGLEGWADDNCSLELSVEVRVTEDCSGNSFPGKVIPGAVKLIERIFTGTDGVSEVSCTQQIWVVDYDRFYISDESCENTDPNDGVIWPCDVLLTTCPDDLGNTGEPIILDDGCSTIGMTHEDTRYDFVDGVCYKILREWKIIDWCQFDANTGYGIWTYVQAIKVADADGAEFLDAPTGPVEYCLADPGISLPDNNQIFLGENDPESSSCSVHVDLGLNVHDACSGAVTYDVKIYPFNGLDFIQIVPETQVLLDTNHNAEIRFNTQTSGIPSIEESGLPYTSAACGEYHRALWTVEDGCGNRTYADYLFRLEDCKDPTPVCIEGISTVIMQQSGEVTLNASSFNASSFDDCTPGAQLLFSFSGDTYQPTFTYTCDNVPAFDVELPISIWAADGGVDQNCNGQIEWSERNKDFCITTIVINDNNNVCENQGGILAGEVITVNTEAVSNVTVRLSSPGNASQELMTTEDGQFIFNHFVPGTDYVITPERNDNHRNGVSTLDLVRIQKHLLGQEAFSSPYQYIAADANNSQSITAIDLIEIRKVILGLQDEFASNQSWRFVQSGSTMAPGNPWPFNEKIELDNLDIQGGSNMDFVGVKIGDVNNTVQANASQVLPRSGNNNINIKATAKGNVEAGEVIEVELAFPQVVSGFQWTIEANGLELVDVSSDDILIHDQHIGRHQDGTVTMSWNGDLRHAKTEGQGMILRLKYSVTQSGRLMDMLDITSKVTAAEAYTDAGEILGVNLTFNSAGIFDDFALYQNKPNPWSNHTTIGFHLPIDAPATMTVYDLNGKVIKIISDQYKAGYNAIVLSVDDIPASGVYYYRLESGGYVASKKMVMVR